MEAATNFWCRVLGETSFARLAHQCLVFLPRGPGPDDCDRHTAHLGPRGQPSGAGEPDVGSFGCCCRRPNQEGPSQGTLRRAQRPLHED
eukprot:7148519-Alexandrium_andersonii.AAC.1